MRIGFVLVVCYLVAWLDRMAINMAVPFISKDLDIGPDKVGWILSAFFLGYALCQVPGGLLADRFGPRIVILAALAWWTAFTGFTGLATSLGVLLAIRFLFGLGEGLFPAAVWKVLGETFSTTNRATANSLVLSSIAIGPAITPLLLAPMLSSWGWRVSFAVLGVAGAGALALAFKYLRVERVARPAGPPQRTRPCAARPARTLPPGVLLLALVALAGNIAMYGWLNWLPTYLMHVKGMTLGGVAWAASLPFAFGAVGCMSSGYVSDRLFAHNRRALVIACQAIGGTCLFGFTQIDDVTTFMILQCIAAFFLFMSCGALWALPMVLLPKESMGTGTGIINTGGQIGGFLTNIIIGHVIAWRGNDYASGFLVLFAGLVASASLLLLVREAGVEVDRREVVGRRREVPEREADAVAARVEERLPALRPERRDEPVRHLVRDADVAG